MALAQHSHHASRDQTSAKAREKTMFNMYFTKTETDAPGSGRSGFLRLRATAERPHRAAPPTALHAVRPPRLSTPQPLSLSPPAIAHDNSGDATGTSRALLRVILIVFSFQRRMFCGDKTSTPMQMYPATIAVSFILRHAPHSPVWMQSTSLICSSTALKGCRQCLTFGEERSEWR